jgi:hypothetical protein
MRIDRHRISSWRRLKVLRGALLSSNALYGASSMIETNPIHNLIADLRERVAALRGYL